jgi:preprotein translocase subunit SecD
MILNREDSETSSAMVAKLTNEELYVCSKVIADSSNVQSASVEKSKWGGHILTIILDLQGGVKMNTATSDKKAKLVGLLVDGELFAAPIIREPISDVFELAFGSLSDSELEEFAATMSSLRTVQ